jgi:5-methylcytosine-specific restriction endonuclease McrA
MTHKVPDGVEVWKQFEDLLIPGLRLSVIERAVYSHLLRHSRLEGKRRLLFSIHWLARGAGLCDSAAREGVRRLAAKGALRLAERSKRGHVIEVRLPEEVRGVRTRKIAEGEAERLRGAASLEETDFLEKRALREAIHAREGGHCFYCLRRVTAATRCIDHVIPRVRMGRNCYRNLVSTCAECNSQKGERQAEDFLRWLYGEGRLESSELKERLRALEKMASGKMRPAVNSKTRRPEAARPEREVWG